MVCDNSDERTRAGWDGLLIALSNPKIALFFAALFSQFIQPQQTLTERLVVAVTAASIDAVWYVLVAISLSRLVVTRPFQRYVTLLNKVFGAILIMLSLAVFRSLW